MYNPYANSAFAATSDTSGSGGVHQRGHVQHNRAQGTQQRLYQPQQNQQNQYSNQPVQPQPQYGYNPQQPQQQQFHGHDNSGYQYGQAPQQSPPQQQVPLQPQQPQQPQQQQQLYYQYPYGSQGQVPQQPQQQLYMGSPQNSGSAPLNSPGQQFGSFFNDPTTMLATQFAKTGFDTSNQYIQQNITLIIGTGGNIKYYFKVSNSYVVRKLLIILFPFYNKTWNRLTNAEVGYVENNNGDPNQAAIAASKASQLAPPCYDVNAPDLYIPLMAFTTYILLWAAFQGLQGDFHPQLFGYLASQTMAFSVLDIGIFVGGLYFLNCYSQSFIWDLISFSGYKYVVIIVLLAWKHLLGTSWFIYYPVMFGLIANLAVFLMRSLRFMILPNANSTSNTITASQRRIRIQFLFVYSVIVQGAIILFMSR